jgi:hypothetical protein
MRPLEQTQREFFAALQMPLRGKSRRSTELPPSDEGHSQEFLTKADELMKPGSNLSSAERLELYHRQYWFRVLDSIAEDFPVLQKMAGEDTFWALMEAYLSECPSSSFTLRHLGRRLADFTGKWDEIDESKRRWFSSIARLEYADMEIYESAEWEPVPPEQLATATLGLQPHVKLIALPVEADLCKDWESFSPDSETPIHIAVWRAENGGSLRCRIDPVEFVLLSRLRAGGTLSALFAEPTDREPEPQEVSEWFSDWQSRKWIALQPAAEAEEFPVVRHRETKDVDWDRIDKMGSQARAMED